MEDTMEAMDQYLKGYNLQEILSKDKKVGNLLSGCAVSLIL